MLNRATDTVWRASILAAGQRRFIAVIATIVIPITQPKRLDTDCSCFTPYLVARAGHIFSATHLNGLIAVVCILTVVDTVTELVLRDTPGVVTGVHTLTTLGVGTAEFVCAVSAVILMITFPVLEDTTPIATPKKIYLLATLIE